MKANLPTKTKPAAATFEKINRAGRSVLVREGGKLDPNYEQAMAEEGSAMQVPNDYPVEINRRRQDFAAGQARAVSAEEALRRAEAAIR